jgi:methylglyoxal reductase
MSIGLGTFPFSNVFGMVDAADAADVTDLYFNEGGHYIQTAPYYEGVDSLMAQILRRYDRSNYSLATLCVKDRRSELDGSRSAVFAQCEDSLRTLRTDYIDLYMTSTPVGVEERFGETIDAMNSLKEQGKVREIGICNVTLEELEEYNYDNSVRYVQNRMSLIDQEQDRDVRAYCVERDIKLVPYNVIEWGLLTNRILDDSLKLRDGDLRTAVLPVFDADRVGTLREWARACLAPVARERGVSIATLAVLWAMTQPGVDVALIGATRKVQLAESMAAERMADREEIVAALDNAYDTLASTVRDRFGGTVNEYLRNSFGLW